MNNQTRTALQTLAMTTSLVFPLSGLAQSVTLHYFPRPPYVYQEGGQLVGLTGAVAAAAFRSAGITTTVQDTPASRFLVIVKRDDGLDCGIGWFKNPEREEFGKFTKAIYQDEAMAALTVPDNTRISTADSVESVLANKDLKLLVKQSFSYGKTLDAMMERLQPNRQIATVENVQMVKMIQARRADYMLISPEESVATIAAAGYQPNDFKLLRLVNMPKGESRYILCSKSVPDELIVRINAAIR